MIQFLILIVILIGIEFKIKNKIMITTVNK